MVLGSSSATGCGGTGVDEAAGLNCPSMGDWEGTDPAYDIELGSSSALRRRLPAALD